MAYFLLACSLFYFLANTGKKKKKHGKRLDSLNSPKAEQDFFLCLRQHLGGKRHVLGDLCTRAGSA